MDPKVTVKLENVQGQSNVFGQDSAFLQQYQELLQQQQHQSVRALTQQQPSGCTVVPQSQTVQPVQLQSSVPAPTARQSLLGNLSNQLLPQAPQHARDIPQQVQYSQIQQTGIPKAQTLPPGPVGVQQRPTHSATASLVRYGINSRRLQSLAASVSNGNVMMAHSHTVGPDVYYRKWRRLKKMIKNMIFINASGCDEVVRVEEKIAKAKEERRFLLRKVLHYQSLTDGPSLTPKQTPGGAIQKAGDTPETQTGRSKAKKKASSSEKKKSAKAILENLQAKPKKSKAHGGSGKRMVPPIPLDPLGRPVLPLVIGDLTIHSLGEVSTEKSGFHSAEHIYPVGFCSTRVYATIDNPEQRCLYTCKISDGGNGPVFEISPEDSSEQVFRSHLINDCHVQLLKSINQARGSEVLEGKGKGGEFFGLSHPVVQNLIQSCPGARKCTSGGYKWVRYEVSKSETLEGLIKASKDPSISFEALRSSIQKVSKDKGPHQSSLDSSTSLRSLLTSGPFPNATQSSAAQK